MTRTSAYPDTDARRLQVARNLGALHATAHRTISRALQRLLAADGLTPRQFQVLYLLRLHGSTSQSELAEALGVESQSLVRLLDTMTRGGWVRRVPDASDRRVNRVELAADASRLARVFTVFEQMQVAALSEFSEHELETFQQLHSKLLAGLQKHVCGLGA